VRSETVDVCLSGSGYEVPVSVVCSVAVYGEGCDGLCVCISPC
jgi:hypothetical protein